MEAERKTSTNILSQLPPKFAFLFGLIVAFAAISTIGFFVLLGITVDDSSSSDASVKSAAVEADPSPNPTSPPPGAAAPSGTIDIESLDHVRGSGDITLVEYSDTECPFCARFHPTMQQVMEEYDGRVRWVYKHFPLSSLHRKAQREAEATECAAEQGKFWEYTDTIFEITPSNDGLADNQLFTIADQLGLDRPQFDDCLESGKYATKVQSDYQEATSLGGTGTPFSVLIDANGNIIDSISGALPYSQLSAALDQVLQ